MYVLDICGTDRLGTVLSKLGKEERERFEGEGQIVEL